MSWNRSVPGAVTSKLGSALSADDLAEPVDHRNGDPPGVADGFGECLERAQALERGGRRIDAEQAALELFAEGIGDRVGSERAVTDHLAVLNAVRRRDLPLEREPDPTLPSGVDVQPGLRQGELRADRANGATSPCG